MKKFQLCIPLYRRKEIDFVNSFISLYKKNPSLQTWNLTHSCQSAGSLKVACDAFHTIFYYCHSILVLCYERKESWTFFWDTKLFGSECQKPLITWGLESTGVSERNDAVNSSCPDVSLHTVLSLPLSVPLIYLVKENGRHHWRCNCLSASLLVSITEQ